MDLNNQLQEFTSFLIKKKYKNILNSLILDVCPDDDKLIKLSLIKIKASQRRKGYGDAILDDIINFADANNVRIKLWITDIYGIDKRVLIEFYKKHGFVLIKNNEMIYYPSKS